MPLFAGGVAAFSVAALVVSFVRRTKKKLTKRPSIEAQDHKKKTWGRQLGDDLKNVWATGSRKRRNSTYVNPIDVWQPSDLERGLERIPGPPSILEMDGMDGVETTATSRNSGDKRFEDPVDAWTLSDQDKGLDQIASRPNILATDSMDGVTMASPDEIDESMSFIPQETVVKLESREQDEDMGISPVPSSVHSPGEPLVCTYPGCSKIFPGRGALAHHQRYHTRNHNCPHCDSAFAVVKDLRRHMSSKHTPKDAKRVWFCTVHGCKNAKLSMPRAGIDRKDNWQRHMRVSHRKSPGEITALEAEARGDA